MGQLDGDRQTRTLTHSTSGVRVGVRVMIPVANTGTVISYQVADCLVREADRQMRRRSARRGVEGPRRHLLDADDMVRAARAAQERAFLRDAGALLRAATPGRCIAARAALVELLHAQDRRNEAERVHERGINADGKTAAVAHSNLHDVGLDQRPLCGSPEVLANHRHRTCGTRVNACVASDGSMRQGPVRP